MTSLILLLKIDRSQYSNLKLINFYSFYTLVASKTLRPNSDFLVSVSMQNTSEPTFVVVEISGNQDSGGIFKTTDSVSVEPFSTRIVRLEVRNGDLHIL